MRKYILIFATLFLAACGNETKHADPLLFELLDGKAVGIEFTNIGKKRSGF